MTTSPPLSVRPAAVLAAEAHAITAAADRLDETAFAQATRMLASCTGKVVCLGAGTSGILARKVAATLTSTGTSAIFLHPSDALHGGLGAVGTGDVALALSNSGETDEILVLLPHLRRRGVPLVAMVGNCSSTLAHAASVVLDAGADREADRHDLVPTASSAVALAMGDALAVAVMEERGTTAEDFARNHPSGRLGRRLTLHVADLMHADAAELGVTPTTPWLSVVSAISKGGVGAVVVLDDAGRLLGIVTDGDVRRAIERIDANGLTSVTAAHVMTAEPVAVSHTTLAYDALRLMEDRPSQISVLPVVDELGRCVGLVRVHDLIRAGL